MGRFIHRRGWLLCATIFLLWASTLANRSPPRCGRGRCATCVRQRIAIYNGYYDTVSRGPPLVVRARCRRGFQLTGRAERTCNVTARRFSGSPPRCIDIDECERSNSPCHANATCINLSGSYKCRCLQGYIGDGKGQCTQAIKCPPLLAPPYGQVSHQNNRAKFRCDEGYVIGGFDMLSCDLTTGQWSHDPPFCMLSYDNCGNPGVPENGIKYGSCHTIGCVVRYRCNGNYILDGPPGRTCLSTRSWSMWLPVCRLMGGIDGIAASIRENFVDKISVYSSSSIDSSMMDKQRLNINHAVGIDLVFMFDRSSSIAPPDFNKGITFAEFILDELGMANKTGATRVATVSFGDEAKLEFNLDDPEVVGNLTAAKIKLRAIQPSGGGTATTAAFSLVMERVSVKLRPRAKHAVFIITDGRSTMGADPEAIARNLRVNQRTLFEIYAIGVGSDVDRRQLRRIASEPYLEHVFLVENYDILQSLTDIIVEKRTNYERCGVSGNIEAILGEGNQGQGEGQPGGQGRDGRQGPEGRVVGGDGANQGAWPWLALVKAVREDGGTDVLCSGSLVCPGWVVTAAQCLERRTDGGAISPFYATNLTVTGGEHDRFLGEGAEQTVVVREIIRHPDYQPGGHANNIALLKLEPELVISKYVRTVCVPKNDSEFTLMKISRRPNTEAWFAGWGTMDPMRRNQTQTNPQFLSDVPRQIKIPVVDRDFCESSAPGRVTEDSFCAGYQYLAIDICKGDIGGPLVARTRNDQFMAIGVAHRQEECAQFNKYGVFTDVIYFQNWIHNVTGGCNIPYH